MNLTPDQRRQGEQNFQGAIASDQLKPVQDDQGNTVSRREFLKGSVTAGLVSAGGLGSYYFGYGASVDQPVRIGIIGTGDEGGVLIGALNPEYVQVVAIADIRPYNIYRAFNGDASSVNAEIVRPGLISKYGRSAAKDIKVYGNAPEKFNDGVLAGQTYAQLLANPDIEGVIIALPLHLHAQVAIEAMRAGKHVLTEKLMAKTVKQCKEMGRVARKEDKYLATGHQRHYSILYDNAVQLIKNGVLGDLHHIRAQWHRGNLPGKDSWQPLLPKDIQKLLVTFKKKLGEERTKKDPSRQTAIQRRIALLQKQAWDALLEQPDSKKPGQTLAERYGYQNRSNHYSRDGKSYHRAAVEELIRWRLFERTGGGLMAELGSHQLDAASIFISAMFKDGHKVHPLRVTGMGGRSIFPHDRDCEDHVYCNYEFPAPGYNPRDRSTHENKIVVTYSSINGNDFGGYGEVVMGTRGTMMLEKEKDVLLFGNATNYTQVKVTKKAGDDLILDTTQSPAGDAQVGEKALNTGPISRGYTEEIEHWAWCIRNPDPEHQPKCTPEVALGDAVIALSSNIAIRLNKIVEFKDAWFEIDDDATPEQDYKFTRSEF